MSAPEKMSMTVEAEAVPLPLSRNSSPAPAEDKIDETAEINNDFPDDESVVNVASIKSDNALADETPVVQGSEETVETVSIKTELTDDNMSDHGVAPESAHVDTVDVDNESSSMSVTSGQETNSAADLKGVDPFDKDNTGDVMNNYFTSATRTRPVSPLEQGPKYVYETLSRNADLYVQVTGHDGKVYMFEVDSTVLAAHSSVFNTMVYSTHTRGNKETWVYELDDKNVFGLKVMFKLMHLDLLDAMFNGEPNGEAVYYVLRAFDTYGISESAYHCFKKSWAAGLRMSAAKTKFTAIQRLYVANKLEDFRSLKLSIRQVALDIELGENGEALFGGKPIQTVMPISNELVEELLTVRLSTFDSLLTPFKEAMDYLVAEGNINKNKYCKSNDAHVDCNQKLLGSLIMTLMRKKLNPLPNPGACKGKARRLAEAVAGMEIRGLYVPGLEAQKQRHARCKLDQDELAQKILNDKQYLPLSEALVKRMHDAAILNGTYRQDYQEFEPYAQLGKKWMKRENGLASSIWAPRKPVRQ